MKIYSMTATFGKLEHETLTLNPGLNVIQAPNEWGKSTWCAFLVAMLYGLDTRAKSTKNSLADKERYAPWSGSPMAGRMDISWQGRDITIERSTKGRVPLGVFRAYETASGLAVPELTAANCGQTLLGVERSVFIRAGFIRLSDLPVTDDEALRRRLNALVTTGDESSAADRLGKGFKDMKNRIRYNRAGLLPQAEAEREALEERRGEILSLQAQMQQGRERLTQLEQWREQLENHRTALAYAAAQADQQRVDSACRTRDEAQGKLREIEAKCADYPERDTAQQVLNEICRLQQEQQDLQMDLQLMPNLADAPVAAPEVFEGLSGQEAVAMAKADRDRHWGLMEKKHELLIFSIVLMLLGIALTFWYRLPGLVCAGVGAVALAAALAVMHSRRHKAQLLEERYGSPDSDQWMRDAEAYAAQLYAREQAAEQHAQERQQLIDLLKQLDENIQTATKGQGLEKCRGDWEEILSGWDAYADARREWQQAEHYYQTLKSMAKSAPAPAMPDALHHSEADTARLLSDCFAERQRLENRMGQYQGRMDALGDLGELEKQLSQANGRIARLEQTYSALEIAQETLAAAEAELQRRFAPRIAQRTQELMGHLTNGRYDRVSLRQDLSLQAGSAGEETLRDGLWRSDGTLDQLYLCLRLAVSGELTQDVPLILDDALVRFDDTRLKAALEILQAEAASRQVILFSCQERERKLLAEQNA